MTQIDEQQTFVGSARLPDSPAVDLQEAAKPFPSPAPSSWKRRLQVWLEDKLERLAKHS